MDKNMAVHKKNLIRRIVNSILGREQGLVQTEKNASPENKYNFGPDVHISLIGGANPEITVGTGTYCNGMQLYCWDERIKISIGNYCSLADKIMVIAGGEHEKEWVSNYPFVKIFEREDLYHKQKVRYKGDILIEHDVWIGNNVTILSGVTIGSGSVVGAGSVVVKDVAPYSIVVGNPAKMMRMRFGDDDIASLLRIKWWEWPKERIQDNLAIFDDVKSFIKRNNVS